MIFAATVVVGVLLKGGGPRVAELGVDIQLSQERNPVVNFLSLAIHYGLGPVGALSLLVLICLGLLLQRRSVVPVYAFGWVVGIGWLAAEVGKRLVGRIRPPADAVQALIHEHGMDSFPSGHTAFAVALAWAFVLVVARTRRARVWAMAAGVVFVAVVAFSRLYLGVHYPSDVIASVFISSAAILLWLPVWNNFIAPRLSVEPRTSVPGPGGTDEAERNIAGTGIWPTMPISSRAKTAGTTTGPLRSKRQRQQPP